MTPIHDVLVVGGGLVGSSLAIALADGGLDVGLLERADGARLPDVFDQRNLSFAEATVNALTALGIMQQLRQPGATIRRIHASRQGDFGRVLLDAAHHGREGFGQVVVARDFGDALAARLAGLPGITTYRPARFDGLDAAADADADADPGWRTLRITDASGPRQVRTRLLVGADGTRSGVRTALGIASDEHDYRQTLLVARVRPARAPDGTAYERLRDDGPTALLPRGDRHYGLVHTVAADDADAVLALDDAAFLARAQDACGWRAGRLLAVGPRSAYAAIRLVATEVTAARAVLVGNAAQTMHPVGAQGFNLGVRDAMTLVELVLSRGNPDPGEPALLAAYAQRRAQDRARTVAFSDGLVRIASARTALPSPLRSLGLVALDALSVLQAPLASGAMGYRGDVPALCRTEVR